MYRIPAMTTKRPLELYREPWYRPAYLAPYRVQRTGSSYRVHNYLTGRHVAVGLTKIEAEERAREMNRDARTGDEA